MQESEKTVVVHGVGIGLCRGAGYLRYSTATRIKSEERGSAYGAMAEELRYSLARTEAMEQLLALEDEVYNSLGAECAHIFATQLLLIEDSIFAELPLTYIREGNNAERGVLLAREYYFDVLCRGEHASELRFLCLDVEDVTDRILSCLGVDVEQSAYPDQPYILVNDSPLASVIVSRRAELLGVVSREGFQKSSSALIAKALDIPCIALSSQLPTEYSGRYAIIDASCGELCINPDLDAIKRLGEGFYSDSASGSEGEFASDGRARTADGVKIQIFFRIANEREIRLADKCSGIEYSEALIDDDELDEELLFEKYRRLCEAEPCRLVAVRSLSNAHIVDVVGSDDENGAFYVQRNDRLRIQLRALMRAAVYGEIVFLAQVYDDASELEGIALLLSELQDELRIGRHEYSTVKVGAIIGDVGALIMCEEILSCADCIFIDSSKITDTLRFLPLAQKKAIQRVMQISNELGKRVVVKLSGDDVGGELLKYLRAGAVAVSVPTEKAKEVRRLISQFSLK